MTATENSINVQQQLAICADIDVSAMIPHLCELIGSRKIIARQMLDCRDDVKLKSLTHVFNHLNFEINKILGVYI